MKNLKRFMAGALALIMVMGMTLTVSATETNSDAQGVPSIEGRYVVKELDEKALKGVPAAERSAIEAVSKGDATDTFSNSIVDAGTSGAQSVADALADKEWLTPFFEVRTEPEGQTTVPEHNFDLTINIPGIGAYSADEIVMVHFNVEKQQWEILSFKPVSGDNVSVHFDSLSPVAVAVKVKAEGTPSTNGSPSLASSDKGTSPKTGTAADWKVFALAAGALALCSVVVFRRKRA